MRPQSTVVSEADLTSLRLLAAVARTGSISAAASELVISQQAASVRMRRLETSVGVPLLTRSSRGSTLTPAGVAAAAWAAEVADAAARFEAGIAALRDHGDEPITVASSLTIAEYLLPRWLMALHETDAAARVAVTATNSERVVALVAAGDARLGFIESPLDAGELGDLAQSTIARDELVTVVSPTHPWAHRREISVPALARTPLITRERGSGTRLAAERMLAEAGCVPVAPLAELPTTAAIRTAVVAGGGAAILSILAVRDDLAAGRLVRVRVRGVRFVRELRAVYRDGAERTGTGAALMAAIARSAG
ncbi:LysR family transcriptional regulator [Gryllotalpicola protaetiae]|uniref:LysR family transcriptional regulator n=1 Tax=Gryllotalpicola protaetiae TaxID=2419771 RepID=A0A387C453_9MICO|nr:LysR family transcriptional regulator [Gryllotalpicola protaetiae]AYG05361.1 LysR family transcriptional regulator [Gryllotalpicola protaetiae]